MIKKSRYIHSEFVKTYQKRLSDIFESYEEQLNVDMIFYRAQLGSNNDNPKYEALLPHSKQRMIPWKDKASEGRINPKGIPCFYMASDFETSIKEIGPKFNDYISVAELKLDQTLNVVSMIQPRILVQPLYSKDDGRRFFQQYLNDDFTKPISNTDDCADYVPTQVIAELIKSKGYNGIKYKSSVGEGENIALFDVGIAERLFSDENISLYQMNDIFLTKIL